MGTSQQFTTYELENLVFGSMPVSRPNPITGDVPRYTETDHHQDTKTPRKTKEFAFAVLPGITFGDTRDKKKPGALVPWW
jgi:hypothetical protein